MIWLAVVGGEVQELRVEGEVGRWISDLVSGFGMNVEESMWMLAFEERLGLPLHSALKSSELRCSGMTLFALRLF